MYKAIFHNQCELLKCCNDHKDFDLIHHNIYNETCLVEVFAFAGSKRKPEADSYAIRMLSSSPTVSMFSC